MSSLHKNRVLVPAKQKLMDYKWPFKIKESELVNKPPRFKVLSKLKNLNQLINLLDLRSNLLQRVFHKSRALVFNEIFSYIDK